MGEIYEITVQGQVDPVWSEWFDGLSITHTERAETILRGPIADQAALYGLLVKARDLGLTLLSVHRVKSDSKSARVLDEWAGD